MYHLIALRFIAAFYPDCVFQSTTVTGEAASIEFKATGKVIVEPGWRTILQPSSEKNPDDEDKILPQFSVGESGPHEPAVLKKATQPPKYYTEGTLLRAMESAGKTVDDETLREAMKENGIGRPSTRAAIIETLFKRGYIYRERKNIMAAQAGIDLIAIINEEILKSAKLTGIWENKLRRIERGDYSAPEFIEELKTMIGEIVLSVLNDNSQRRIIVPVEEPKDSKEKKTGQKKQDSDAKPRTRRPAIKSFDQVVCPVCGKGHMVKGRSAFGCSEYASGCHTVFSFTEYPENLTPAKLAAMIKKKTK